MKFLKIITIVFSIILSLSMVYNKINDEINYNKIFSDIKKYKITHKIKGGIRMKNRPVILGHRGYRSKYPENTILAYLKAIEYGGDGVELDVQLSSDNVLIIHHDDNFEKITGDKRKIREMTSKEIMEIKIEGEPVPTLEEVFVKLPEYAYINVEIKDPDASELAYNVVKSFNAFDRVLFSSFEIESLRRLRKLDKNIDLGLLIEDKERIEKIMDLHKELNFYSLNLPVEGIEMLGLDNFKTLISKFSEIGLHIVMWTLNDIKTLEDLDGYIDAVITDDIEKIVSYYKWILKN